MKFAIQGAQDNGEFFTPPSLVQTLVNVIEPDHGVAADLACGSGGMFAQTSHFMEDHGQETMKRVTFYGQDKTATTIRLAKMNLAAIVWLYRGKKKRFVELVNKQTDASLNAAHDCFSDTEPLDEFLRAMRAFGDRVKPFVDSLKKAKLDGTLLQEYLDANNDATSLVGNCRLMTSDAQKHRNDGADTWPAVVDFAEHLLAQRRRCLGSSVQDCRPHH